MAKKIVGFIKLQVPAGKANPSPPIGPALGQRGLNIMEFCKAFNAQTQGLEPGMHRCLARRAASRSRRVSQAPHGVIEHRGVVRVHDRLHGGHRWMRAERLHSPVDHQLSADGPVLFRAAGAGAQAAAGGNEDGGGPLRMGHGWVATVSEGLRGLPLSRADPEKRAIPVDCTKKRLCCSALARLLKTV